MYSYAESPLETLQEALQFANKAIALDDKEAMAHYSLGRVQSLRGEYDAAIRLKELDGDGIAGEVVFPQMAPFGAGLMQYRHPIDPEHNLAGIQAYNRWLADLCASNPGRHAGVIIINGI